MEEERAASGISFREDKTQETNLTAQRKRLPCPAEGQLATRLNL